MMEFQNPFDKLLGEINALLLALEANKGAPLDDARLPPDALATMKQLEENMKKFETLSQNAADIAKSAPDLIKDKMPPMEIAMPPEAKRVINRCKELMVKAEMLKGEIIDKEKGSIQKVHAEQEPLSQKELEKGTGKKRKGKFRHFDRGV